MILCFFDVVCRDFYDVVPCVQKERSNGEIRVMNCRKGVKKHLKGGVKAYDPKAKKLVFVYDVQIKDRARAYRSIALEGIKRISMAGKEYIVVS